MRDLVKFLVVGGCFLLCAGADVAKAAVELSCGTMNCDYSEEIGPFQTKHYHGHCYGTGNTEVTKKNSHMSCNYVGCTPAGTNKYKGDLYWECECTNWSTTKRAYIPITISCPAPS